MTDAGALVFVTVGAPTLRASTTPQPRSALDRADPPAEGQPYHCSPPDAPVGASVMGRVHTPALIGVELSPRPATVARLPACLLCLRTHADASDVR